MKNRLVKITGVCIFIGTSLIACKTEEAKPKEPKEETNKVVLPSIEELTKVSDSMAAVLKADMPQIVKDHYHFAIARNIDVYAIYPDSDQAAKSLDLAQGYAVQLEDYNQSVRWSEIILEKYPDYKGNEMIMLELANNYNLMLKDSIKAKQTYEKFIETYPKSILVEDAKFSLEHLGMTLEDIVSGKYE